MKILMRRTMATPDFSVSSGQVINLPDDIAERLIADGSASSVEPPLEPAEETSDVSDGKILEENVSDILEVVDGDAEFAARLLDVETAADNPRVTLVRGLNAIVGAGDEE